MSSNLITRQSPDIDDDEEILKEILKNKRFPEDTSDITPRIRYKAMKEGIFEHHETPSFEDWALNLPEEEFFEPICGVITS